MYYAFLNKHLTINFEAFYKNRNLCRIQHTCVEKVTFLHRRVNAQLEAFRIRARCLRKTLSSVFGFAEKKRDVS